MTPPSTSSSDPARAGSVLPLACGRRAARRALVLGLVLSGTLAATASAATITVGTNDAALADDGSCTYPEAIKAVSSGTASGAAAGECPGGTGSDTINFSVTGTITVSATPILSKSATIVGPGAQKLAISGGGKFRPLVANAGGKLTISGLTLRDGFTESNENGIGNPIGGALISQGGLTAVGMVFSSNKARSGGALDLEGPGPNLIRDSAFTDNSTLSTDTSGGGGAIVAQGPLTVVNSTFTRNTAGIGGAIVAIRQNKDVPATLRLDHVTVAGNTASASGPEQSVGGVGTTAGEPVTIRNSIVAGNTGGNCGFDLATSTGVGNLTDVAAGDPKFNCGPSFAVGDPKLGALALNGGDTPSLALGSGSAALDKADATACADAAGANGLDQRGVKRPQGPGCDIGAFEAAFESAPGVTECNDAKDNDGDGFTDAADPSCKAGKGVEAPVDNALAACTRDDLTLIDVVRKGSRVQLVGTAIPSLAGSAVNLLADGKKVATTTIGPDGSFSASLKAPAKSKRSKVRYQAVLGSLKTQNLKLDRRLATDKAAFSGGRVVFTGRLVDVKRFPKGTRVTLLGRSKGCGAFKSVGTAKLDAKGRFSVRVKPFAGQEQGVYRVRTKIRGVGRTFTLPRVVSFG